MKGFYFFIKQVIVNIKKLAINYIKNFSKEVQVMDPEKYLSALVKAQTLFKKQKKITEETFKPLHKSFSKRHVRSNLLGKIWWEDFLYASTNNDNDGKKVQEKMIKEIDSIEIKKFNHWELLHFYSLSLNVGLFNVAYAFRKKALSVAINYLNDKKYLNSKFRIAGLAALLESGNYDDFKKHIDSCKELKDLQKSLFIKLFEVVSNKKIYVKQDFLKERLEYHKTVNSKTVAIVGPAKTDKKDAQEIDSHDLVVRINYKEQGVGIDSQIKGTKVNIVYINNEQGINLIKNPPQKWPYEIDWVVCKMKEVSESIKKLVNTLNISNYNANKEIKATTIYNLNSLLFNGSFNILPNIIFDLLLFYPSKINVFHADLMLTINRNKGYYPDSWEREEQMKKIFLSSCAKIHDPVTQYWFLKQTWNNKLFSGDQRLNEVMSLGEKEYMNQLQQIYGNAGRLLE